MKKLTVKLILGLMILSGVYANANNYNIQNKNYTYEQVTEILSDKIIELQKKFEYLNSSENRYSDEQLSKINNLENRIKKLEEQLFSLNNKITGEPFQEISKQKPIEIVKKKQIKSNIKEIIMDRELYEKGRDELNSN